MEFLKHQYKKCFVFLQEKMKRITAMMALLFVVVIAVSAIYLQSHPDLIQQLIQEFMEMASSNGIVNDSGAISSTGLMTNNIMACLMSISFGVLPFIFLPLVPLLSNAALMGAMVGFYNLAGLPMSSLVLGILPHGIFELPALILSMSLGIYLCKEISLKIIGKRKGASLGDVFVKVVRVFLCIVVPLLVIAGVVEAYITPVIMGM